MKNGARCNQRGVVLIIALVALAVMTIAGLMMFRAIGGGMEIAGNIGFKQNATSLGDLGIEHGRTFLMQYTNNATPLEQNNTAAGYFASWNDAFDPIRFDWSTAARATAEDADDGTGNHVRYVIHRMCAVAGPTNGPGQRCSVPAGSGALGGGGGSDSGYGSSPPAGTGQPYYRITSRVDGPRGTVSYVQVILF